MQPHDVHVWHVQATDLNKSALEGIEQLLSPDEIKRWKRYHFEKDRTMHLVSRGLMRTVLGSYLGCPPTDVEFTVNAHGKPILRPVGVGGIQFNLSHSGGAAALAVALNREVGIDIEDRSRCVEYVPLAERFFTHSEAQHLRSIPDGDVSNAFFATWTLKEAFVKAIGKGLTFPLDAFAFDLEGRRLIGFRPLADIVSPDWHFWQFELGTRHCGAVAVQAIDNKPIRVELREWQAAFTS